MINVKVKTDLLQIEDTRERLGNLRPFFTNFWTYMHGRTILTFTRLRKGGSFRGVRWKWFADQYTRKTDGVTVPAEGGVPTLRQAQGSHGKVKGRLRGKGKADKDRVRKTSNLLRHRGHLYNAALDETQIRQTRYKACMRMNTSIEYAGYQNETRPFQFFELPKDEQVAVRMARKYITKGA